MDDENIDIMDGFNAEALDEVKDLMGDKFDLIVDQYLESSMGYLSCIEQGLKNCDAKIIASSAHPLKSSSASLGLINVSQLAQKIELLSDGASEENESLFETLRDLFAQLNTDFKNAEIILRKEVAEFKAA